MALSLKCPPDALFRTLPFSATIPSACGTLSAPSIYGLVAALSPRLILLDVPVPDAPMQFQRGHVSEGADRTRTAQLRSLCLLAVTPTPERASTFEFR